MILGGITLPVIAVRGLSVDESWTHASHARIAGKPTRQPVAPDGRGVSLTCYWHADFGDPAAELERLRELADAMQPVALQRRDGTLLGRFVIESIRSAPGWTLSDGTVLSMSVEIRLGDSGEPEAAARPAAQAVEGAEAQTVTEPVVEDTSRPIDSVPPSEIARL